MAGVRIFVAAALLGLLCPVLGFYLPGVTPNEYKKGDLVRFKVNSITSQKTAIPFDHYSLPICLPNNRAIPKIQAENFGEVLWGDMIKPSMYYSRMLQNITCKLLCRRKLSADDTKTLEKRIQEQYRGHFIVDGLPVTEVFTQKMHGPRSFALGYPLGVPSTPKKPQNIPKTIINNHLAFVIQYHKGVDFTSFTHEGHYRIVGFHVTAHSVNSDAESCNADSKTYVPKGAPVTIDSKEFAYTYSVRWEEEPTIAWSSRWDPYLMNPDSDKKVHWFSIMNSIVILGFLSGMVAYIIQRTLHNDFNKYNDAKNEDEEQEEKGWKLVHGDVFRTPPYPQLLAILVGTGCQLIGMMVITLVFALLGFLSPANRGGLITAMLLLYILLGSYAGYVTARFIKLFKVQNRWFNILLTSIMYPGQVFLVFLFLDIMLWSKHAANAVPFGTIVSLIGLWTCVSTPLVFVGAVLGYKKEDIVPPCAVSFLPRSIPEQKMIMKYPLVNVLLAGVLPFGTAFIEFFYLLSSIWLGRYYHVFGFLAGVGIILTATCAEITIVMIYFQLCFEDWRWWWRGFFIAGSSGLHLFVYSIFYFFSALKIRQFSSILLYFGWMAVMSYTFAIVTGTIGFLSAFMFVKYIYSQIKVD